MPRPNNVPLLRSSVRSNGSRWRSERNLSCPKGMVSTRRRGQAEQVASNALRVGGGCIFADVPNAVTSAAAIVHQVSTHRNTTLPRVTRSSRASSRVSIGFTTTAPKNFSAARSFTPLTRIRWINRRPDRLERYLQTGKRCFTNRRWLFGSAAPKRSDFGGSLHCSRLRKAI